MEGNTLRRTRRFQIEARAIAKWAGSLGHPSFVKDHSPVRASHEVRLVKAANIVVPQLFTHRFAYIFQNADRRSFAIPYEHEFTLIGTTAWITRRPNAVSIESDESAYLCAIVNRYFARETTPQDVVLELLGCAATVAGRSSDPSSVTRDYALSWIASPRRCYPCLAARSRPIASSPKARWTSSHVSSNRPRRLDHRRQTSRGESARRQRSRRSCGSWSGAIRVPVALRRRMRMLWNTIERVCRRRKHAFPTWARNCCHSSTSVKSTTVPREFARTTDDILVASYQDRIACARGGHRSATNVCGTTACREPPRLIVISIPVLASKGSPHGKAAHPHASVTPAERMAGCQTRYWPP